MTIKPFIAGLGLLGCACIFHHSGEKLVPPSGTTIQLNVTNHYGSPVDVFAVGTGTFYQMGTVLPGQNAHFVLHQSMVDVGPVEFVVQLYGSPAARSGRLVLVPGDIVDFEIAEHLLNSSATVRPWPQN